MFMLPIWYIGFIQGVIVGIMLSSRPRPKRTEPKNERYMGDDRLERLERIIQKNRHRIIGSSES